MSSLLSLVSATVVIVPSRTLQDCSLAGNLRFFSLLVYTCYKLYVFYIILILAFRNRLNLLLWMPVKGCSGLF